MVIFNGICGLTHHDKLIDGLNNLKYITRGGGNFWNIFNDQFEKQVTNHFFDFHVFGRKFETETCTKPLDWGWGVTLQNFKTREFLINFSKFHFKTDNSKK